MGSDETPLDGPGVSIAEAFPGDRIEARFVVAMSMARNDIGRAIHDGHGAEDDPPELSYRVRVLIGHLVEALASLAGYAETYPEVRTLCNRVPPDQRKHLSTARGTPQRVGPNALDHVRNHTFHYPSPRESSDDAIRDVLDGMSDRRALIDTDHDSRRITLVFASDTALALALGKHAQDDDTMREQFHATRDGAVAFVQWVDALVLAYFAAFDIYLGEPEWIRGGPDDT